MDSKELTQEKIDTLIGLYTEGKIDKAIKTIENLIIDNSDESILFNLLGACKAAQDDIQGALINYTKAVEINPSYSDAYFNLGNIYQQLNQIDESINSYKKSIELNPKFPEAHNNLGNIYQQLFMPDEAIVQFENAIKYGPHLAEAHYNLAFILNSKGRKNDSIEHYEKCIELNPEFVIAHNNLGKIFLDIGNNTLAESCFEKVIELDPNYAEAYNNLGAVLQNLGNLNYAIQCYEKSISIAPDSRTLNNLGIALQEIGKLDEAAKSFHKAILTNPESADSYHNLSYLTDLSKNEAIINQMKAMHSNQSLKLEDRSLISLALAKVYETQGSLKDFFKFLHEGNVLRKKELNYSIQEPIIELKAIKKIFSSNAITQDTSFTESSKKRVIFIVGMPRSGTTLVEQILSSHKSVFGAGELRPLTNLVKPLINNFIEDETREIRQSALSFVHHEYNDSLLDLNFSENIVTDKLPLNFQYIGFILASFPDAKIVHLKRDPIATCWSNYRCSFTSRSNGYSYNFDDLIKFYSLYEDIMGFWNNIYPNTIYEQSYEELTENQEKETRKLLKYCDLEWDENCLNFHNNKRGVQTASTIQVRKKMYQGSSEDWKKYWTYLQPLIDGLRSIKNNNNPD